jgi:TPR repeat protein
MLGSLKHRQPHIDFTDASHAEKRKAALHYLQDTKGADYQKASSMFLDQANAGDLIAWLHWAYIQPQYLHQTDYQLPRWVDSRVAGPVKKLADGGNAEAAYVLALYYGNYKLPERKADVRAYLERSAAGRYVPGMIGLGYDLHNGYYGGKDLKTAQAWFEKAAETGDPEAKYFLASLYKEADYEGHDYARAFDLYKQCADAGYKYAYYAVAWCYSKGIGTRINKAAANEWLERGARLHDEQCLYELGNDYAKGIDVQKDLRKARACLEEASALGYGEATKALEELDGPSGP